MKCPQCGFANRPDARFCKQCGQPLPGAPLTPSPPSAVTCPSCGAAVKPGARFCKQCGQPLPGAPPTPAPPAGATCPACGAPVRPEARFCPRCGEPLVAERVPPAPPPAPPSSPPAAPLPPSAEGVEVHIEGGVSGQVAIGNNILQIGAVHGGIVNIAMPEERPRPRPRPSPVSLRPRPFPDLLNREAEVDAATAALQSATPVEFHGQAGLGKTALLRHLAHHPAATSFPDGVVYLSARRQPVEDLLQSLYDAFYEADVPFKPTDTEVRKALQGKRALVMLDDVELARDEVEALMDIAPDCTFLLASPERRLWGEGRALGLHGLPPDDGLALVERELGRSVTTPQEKVAAQALCTVLDGHPLRILQAAAMAQEEALPLAEVVRRVQTPSPAEALTAQVLATLPEAERRVLAALAALGGAPLPADHVAEVAGLPDVVPVLDTLQQRGLVQAHSPRYSLAGTLGEAVWQMWDLNPWMERALAYFTTWAEGQRQAPGRLLEASDAILRTLEWAVGAGRWTEVLRLGWAVEGALALGGRWSAWAQVLKWVLQAARALGNQAAGAWALHQLGTRALCLGDATAARTSLTQALRLRKALGDRAGAAVTRHNLNLLPGVPPAVRRKPPAPKARPPLAKWLISLVGVTVGVGVLVVAALVIIPLILPTPTPPPPPTLRPTPTSLPPTEVPVEVPATPTPLPLEPWVAIELAGGCDREYNYGDQTRLFVETNVEGFAEVWLDDELLEEIRLAPGEAWDRSWTFEDVEPGEHLFIVALRDESGEFLAEAGCPFALMAAEVEVWLAEGCEQEYEPGVPTEVLFWSSVDGRVEVWLDEEELLFEREVAGGETYAEGWTMVWGPGEHLLTAVLVDREAVRECRFFVRQPTPTITRSPTPTITRSPTPTITRSPTPSITPSPTPDTTGPPVPTALGPGNTDFADSETLDDCPVTLRWSPVSDPSGVIYRVELERSIYAGTWDPEYSDWESGSELDVPASHCTTGGVYRWHVTARDGVGNWSAGWSDWLYYGISFE